MVRPAQRHRSIAASILASAFVFAAGTAGAEVDYINGGIGLGEAQRVSALMRAHDLRLVFSEGTKGAHVSNVALRIVDGQGREVLALADAGPLTGVRLPPGRYDVDARYRDTERRRTVELRAGAPVDLYLNFPSVEKP
jgi:hypothetical protein